MHGAFSKGYSLEGTRQESSSCPPTWGLSLLTLINFSMSRSSRDGVLLGGGKRMLVSHWPGGMSVACSKKSSIAYQIHKKQT